MVPLVFIALLLTFQFASSQDTLTQECIDATLALSNAPECQTNDASVLCANECVTLVGDLFDACPAQVNILYTHSNI